MTKEISELKQKQIHELEEQVRSGNTESEHEMQVNKAKARVTAIDGTIKNALNEREKKIAHLDSEIAHLEKLKRQLERKKKTESQSIDEEYERKIQVEQVHLREKVDNIAKLFDAEENKRGIEIIEAIRKVKETNNHTDDFLNRKRHELQSLVAEYDKTIDDLRKEINMYNGDQKEEELAKAIEKTKADMVQSVDAIKERQKKEQNNSKELMKSQEKANADAFRNLEQQSKSSNDEYQKEIARIKEQRQKVLAETEKAKQECQREFDAKKEKLHKDHAVAIDRMKARITAAHKLRDEMSQKYEAERAKAVQKNQEEIEQRSQENVSSNANMFSQAGKTSEDLSIKISELSKQQTDVELQIIDPQVRETEKRKMNVLKLQIESLAETQESTFQTFYTTIRSAPTRVRELEPQVKISPAPPPSRERKVNTQSSSRSSRRDVSRVITPVDRARRRPQVLITPQLSY